MAELTKYSVLVVGGGPAGIATTKTLANARFDKVWSSNHDALTIDIADTGTSDLLAAELWNVPGVVSVTSGTQWLEQLKAEVLALEGINWIQSQVVELKWADNWEATFANGHNATYANVVLAGGYKSFQMRLPQGVQMNAHLLSPKPRQCLALGQGQIVLNSNGVPYPRLRAAGTLAGVHSMVACVVGSGVAAACHLLSEINGAPIHLHDSAGSRNNH